MPSRHRPLTPVQGVALLVSYILSAVSLLLVLLWLLVFNGGFAWDARRAFNYHPLLMVLAWSVFTTQAVLSYRALPCTHEAAKRYHAATHTCTLACAVAGLYAVVSYHTMNGYPHLSDRLRHHNSRSARTAAGCAPLTPLQHPPPLPSYSLHSWMGVLTLSLFTVNVPACMALLCPVHR